MLIFEHGDFLNTGKLNFIRKYRSGVLYGLALAALLFLLKWLELRLWMNNYAAELYIGCIALLFTALGIWLALKLTTPRTRTVFVDRQVPAPELFQLNEVELQNLGISKREIEVLQLMAQGLSNQEIAARLFVSLNTVKTHSSRLFEKMEVSSRMQAVERGRKLQIIR